MPAVTLSTVVDLSKIKMKWKEQYVSEGLNHKTSSTLANGIYKGLTLVQNLSAPSMVSVSVGSDTVHAAVYQSAAGFSLTYFDVAGSTFALNLSDANLLNREVVVVLEIVYQVGADTTANWVAYPITDWNALSSAAQAERVVIGSIDVPSGGSNITTSMINMKRRSWSWENATGDLSWSPLVKNGTFEHAEINATTDYSASYWRFGSLSNALMKVQNSGARSGSNCLAVDHTVTGLFTTEAEQYIGARVTGGQLFKYRFYLQNLKIPVSGNGLRVTFRFVRANMVTEDDVLVITSLSSIDATYREISDTVAVPANAAFLVSVYIDYTNNQSSTGIALRIDDLQVWLQTTGATAPVSEVRVQQFTHTGAVVLEDNDDPFADFFGEAIMLRNKATELRIERRDLNRTTGSPILISPTNGIFQKVGEDLLNTEARALLPRFKVPISTTGGVEFTLMWESARFGETVGTYTQGVMRRYGVATGGFMDTVNARWDGTNWNKDIAGQAAQKWVWTGATTTVSQRLAGSAGTWTDAGWDSAPFTLTNSTGTLAITGVLKHGLRTRVISWVAGMTLNASSTAPSLNGSMPDNRYIEAASLNISLPVPMELGERVLNIRAYIKDTVSTAVFVEYFAPTIASTGAIGNITSAQNGTDQTLTATAVNYTLVSGAQFYVHLFGTNGASTVRLYRIEVDYDRP